MGAAASPSRSPRALLLALAALIGLLLFYQTHASIRASDEFGSIKAYLTSDSSYVRLSAAPAASDTEERGMLLLLSSDTIEGELERVACDILKIRSEASDKKDPLHIPVAHRHLTIAVEDSQDASLSFAQVEEHLRRLMESGACTGGDTIERSLSIRKVNERSLASVIDALSPLAILHAKNGRLRSAVDAVIRKSAGSIISIAMPNADLEHSGWIFSLPEMALKAWHVPKFKNILITNDRSVSLRRLYRSLQNAHYFGDGVDMSVKVEASADDATIKAITDMTGAKSPDSWKLGRSDVFFRFRQAGLICNIVEAWYPTSNDEYAFFFEDDIEASPFFYAWAKWAILMYRYGPDSRKEPAKNILGISLIQQMTSELDRATGRIMWSAGQEIRKLGGKYQETSPYLSQVPSSWGAVYFPEHWREFHDYIQVRDGEEIVPKNTKMVAPYLVSDSWGGSWKRFLIELIFLRGYSMLYPNYAEWASLSTNHVELGEHIDPKKQAQLRKMQEVPLMADNLLLEVPERKLSPIEKLPVFDLWGKNTDAETLVTRGVNRHKDLWNCTTARSRSSDFNSFALFACL